MDKLLKKFHEDLEEYEEHMDKHGKKHHEELERIKEGHHEHREKGLELVKGNLHLVHNKGKDYFERTLRKKY